MDDARPATDHVPDPPHARRDVGRLLRSYAAELEAHGHAPLAEAWRALIAENERQARILYLLDVREFKVEELAEPLERQGNDYSRARILHAHSAARGFLFGYLAGCRACGVNAPKTTRVAPATLNHSKRRPLE